MIKYAKVINEETKACEVGLGTNTEFYKSIGMTELDVEKAYNENWYLVGYAPKEPEKTYTELRQKEVADIAGKADIVIIVGGKNSANTTHLAEISKNIQTKTYHVEDASDIKQEWFENVKVAGISGGSSTPHEDIKEVGEIIKSF